MYFNGSRGCGGGPGGLTWDLCRRIKSTEEEVAEAVEMFVLAFSLKCFQSDFLDKKVCFASNKIGLGYALPLIRHVLQFKKVCFASNKTCASVQFHQQYPVPFPSLRR